MLEGISTTFDKSSEKYLQVSLEICRTLRQKYTTFVRKI
jgi:hypothetical protein